MIPAEHIITTLHRHWDANLPISAPTLYAGTRLDTSRLDEWYELWIDAWADSARRDIAPDQLTVSILVHCFARHPTKKTAVHRLATAARETLAGRVLSIEDVGAIPPVSLGCLRITEHSVRDLTRNHAALGQERLQHLVLVFDATAQQAHSTAA